MDDLSVLPVSGKIVTFGDCGVLARYNPDGSLDGAFGGDGTVLPNQLDDDPRYVSLDAFTVQPDGKLVVGGQVAARTRDPEFTLMRLNEDGTLDTGFGGGDGKLTADVSRDGGLRAGRGHRRSW